MYTRSSLEYNWFISWDVELLYTNQEMEAMQASNFKFSEISSRLNGRDTLAHPANGSKLPVNIEGLAEVTAYLWQAR